MLLRLILYIWECNELKRNNLLQQKYDRIKIYFLLTASTNTWNVIDF